MMKTLLVLLALLVSSSSSAQSTAADRLTPAFPTSSARQAADITSWATAITAIGADTWASWHAPRRARALELEGVRIGITYGAAFLVKKAVHRSRPCAPSCGIDDADSSFYSAHSAIAFSTVGGSRLELALPLSITTGGLRIAAGKHWLTDVLAGAGAGLLVSRIR